MSNFELCSLYKNVPKATSFLNLLLLRLPRIMNENQGIVVVKYANSFSKTTKLDNPNAIHLDLEFSSWR